MRVYLRVKGRVQGVGYRYFVIQTAQKHSLTGWVRNRSDWDVEGEAQGNEKEIREFLKQLETGHPWARVDHMHHEEVPEKKNERRFDLQY